MCQLSSRLITNWPNGGWSNNWHTKKRDALGWLPPRLTFDADGRSAAEAAAGAVGGALKASRIRPNCSSVSRLLNTSLDQAILSACTCKRGKF